MLSTNNTNAIRIQIVVTDSWNWLRRANGSCKTKSLILYQIISNCTVEFYPLTEPRRTEKTLSALRAPLWPPSSRALLSPHFGTERHLVSLLRPHSPLWGGLVRLFAHLSFNAITPTNWSGWGLLRELNGAQATSENSVRVSSITNSVSSVPPWDYKTQPYSSKKFMIIRGQLHDNSCKTNGVKHRGHRGHGGLFNTNL